MGDDMVTIQEHIENLIHTAKGIEIRIPEDLKVSGIDISNCKEEEIFVSKNIRISALILKEPVITSYTYNCNNALYINTSIDTIIYKIQINGVPLLIPANMEFKDWTHINSLRGSDIVKTLLSVLNKED